MALTIRSREDAVKLGPLAVAAWDEHVRAAAPKQSVKTASGKGLLGQTSAEQRFDDRYLWPMLSGRQIVAYKFIGKSRLDWRFPVVDKLTYTPDYVIWRSYDEQKIFIEIKGNFHAKTKAGKVIRGRYMDSLTRLKVVAQREPYVFLLAEYRGKEGWAIKRIPGAGDSIKLNGLFGVE